MCRLVTGCVLFDSIGVADSECPAMTTAASAGLGKSRLAVLLEHFAAVEDPRDVRRITHPLPEVLLLVVCGTMADCDDYDHIAEWGEAHLDFLRRYLPYEHGVPGGRWLTILMNRINPGLFSAAFSAWVRAAWPGRPEVVAIDGKTSRRSHDRGAAAGPIHLVSAFATTERLVLGQAAVPDKASELAAIPELLARLAEQDGLQGALVSIDAVATNARIAQVIRDAGADYLLAVKANQPTLRAEVEAAFAAAPPAARQTSTDTEKGHGRIERRTVSLIQEVDWLRGERRFPGEFRLPDPACLIRVEAETKRGPGRTHAETRYYISSARLTAERAGQAIRGHWGIENRLHWVLDVVFGDDQSRLRKGHGAKNMAVVRHFALNLVRIATDKRSIKLRRKLAGWNPAYLASLLNQAAP
jgi:predicted transposase YbfD/YdcC